MDDFSKSINLPRTGFQMRANLNQSENKWIEFWEKRKIKEKIKKKSEDKKKFILHDGPPYANGHIHLGHALNKILKDIICRSFFKLGFDVNFIPGWDCHGLPIEWEVEEKYRKKKKNKDEVNILEFREECRQFANSWIDVQSKEFRRLGLDCFWENKYTTMTRASESIIVAELLKILESGGLYIGIKPVMWSVIEKTALAEAEIEYKEKISQSIFVKFPVKNETQPDLSELSIIIWTTTPWTLPGNRAIAFSKQLSYQLVEICENYEDKNLFKGERIIFSKKLVKDFMKKLNISSYKIISDYHVSSLEKIICRHPLYKFGYNFEVPVLDAEHVTDDTGSGFVHIAPSHGIEDFQVGKKFKLNIPQTVEDNGLFGKNIPLFSGMHIFKSENLIINKLDDEKKLVSKNDFAHSYPHSWRSKKPLIYRTTPQWFISMEKNSLRLKALKEIENVNWIPEISKRRILSMVKERPDWCISRQRSWGVPITIIYNKKTLEPLIDKDLNKRIVKFIKDKGVDAWFDEPVSSFLDKKFDANEYEKVTDILDVWFDSGSSHAFVLKHFGLHDKADLYLEGSDQHRGWFQSSLLESCAIYNESPYKSVLTHGFVLDEKGKKMSKSLGNVISPQDVITKYGADILRLWVTSCNYKEDLKISFESLKRQSENYRKIRNTIRFLLGNLFSWKESEIIEHDQLPDLERFIRHRLYVLNKEILEDYRNYNFFSLIQKVISFCNYELSSIFFDIRKDILYCDHLDSLKRRSVRTILYDVFNCLERWLSPVLPFTTEEAWFTWNSEIKKNQEESCHLLQFQDLPEEWNDNNLSEKWIFLLEIRNAVSQALEIKREKKEIKTSLEADIRIFFEKKEYLSCIEGISLEELCISSRVYITDKRDEDFQSFNNNEIHVKILNFEGIKCERCWKLFEEKDIVKKICHRCSDAHKKTL